MLHRNVDLMLGILIVVQDQATVLADKLKNAEESLKGANNCKDFCFMYLCYLLFQY